MTSTLILGWWGVLALLVRNPQAIAANLRSRKRAPAYPESVGAITLEDARSLSRGANKPQTDWGGGTMDRG
jgi:hypothetical protein